MTATTKGPEPLLAPQSSTTLLETSVILSKAKDLLLVRPVKKSLETSVILTLSLAEGEGPASRRLQEIQAKQL